MPAFAYWPGQVAEHSKSAAPLSTLDILPTFVSLSGSQKSWKPSSTLDGLDLLPFYWKMNRWRKDTLAFLEWPRLLKARN